MSGDLSCAAPRGAYAAPRSPAALALTTLLHAGVLGALLFTWTTIRAPTVSAPAPLVVTMQPQASPQDPQDIAPGPRQVERRDHQEATPPRQPIAEPILQQPQVPSPHVETPTEANPAPPTPPVPETTAPRSIAAPPAPRLSSSARPDWEARLLAHLERFRRYPARAKAAGQQGTVLVHFTMDRAGNVLALKVVRGAGAFGLDQAALDTFRRAEPLPPLPEAMPDRIELTVPVEFYLR